MAPIAWVAIVIQALLFIYYGAMVFITDLITMPFRKLPPLLWLRDRINNTARAIAPKIMTDARDWPILPVMAGAWVVVPASVALQFINPGGHWILWGVLHHAVLVGARGERFAKLFSIKHYESHRPRGIFKNAGGGFFKRPNEIFSTIFYGNPFGIDCMNHVKIHHLEDGGPTDPEGTYGYDRTSAWDFLEFLGFRHLLVSLGVSPLRYLIAHRKMRDLAWFSASVVAFYSALALLFWYDWRLGLVLGVVPILIHNASAGLVGWFQHSFDADVPGADPIKTTISILSPYEFLNDGFHLAHHYRSSTHWSELPARFDEWRSRNPSEEPVVFDGLDWVELAVLMYIRGRMDLVAERWITAPHLSLERRTALLRERLGGPA